MEREYPLPFWALFTPGQDYDHFKEVLIYATDDKGASLLPMFSEKRFAEEYAEEHGLTIAVTVPLDTIGLLNDIFAQALKIGVHHVGFDVVNGEMRWVVSIHDFSQWVLVFRRPQ